MISAGPSSSSSSCCCSRRVHGNKAQNPWAQSSQSQSSYHLIVSTSERVQLFSFGQLFCVFIHSSIRSLIYLFISPSPFSFFPCGSSLTASHTCEILEARREVGCTRQIPSQQTVNKEVKLVLPSASTLVSDVGSHKSGEL